MSSMTADGSGGQPDLTVFAAASLTKAIGELQGAWQAAHPGSELILSLDASSALRAQIEQGAPADILASADPTNAQLLVDGCLARGPITAFAGNALVVVVPPDNPAGISSPADLARPGVRYVAAGPEVPITRYAMAVIDNLAALPGYPGDFAAAVAANTVSEEDNVRAVVAKVELGEADAAIVYLTDAWSSDGVASLAIPAEANVPATYAAVAVGASSQPGLAAEFLEFLTGPEAQAVLASYGFLPPPED
jgi:molybdate transport system substrate-binding protein